MGSAHGSPSGEWEKPTFPADIGDSLDYPSTDPNAYALRITGDAFHPRVKSGEYLVLEPGRTLQPGDEVLVRTSAGKSYLREFAYQRDGQTALNGIVDRHSRLTLQSNEIEYMHYVAAIAKASRVLP